METRGLLAEWDEKHERLSVAGVAKVPFPNRRMLAKMMGLAEQSIRMTECDVGGGFGARGEFYPEDSLVPFAARLLGRPVEWIEDRRENLMACNHSRDAACELEIACEQDGTIVGLRGHVYTDVGAYLRTVGATTSRNIARVMSGPYRVPDVYVEVTLLVTNKTPSGTYRGPARYEADFFGERLHGHRGARVGRRSRRTSAEVTWLPKRRCLIASQRSWSQTSRRNATVATISSPSIGAYRDQLDREDETAREVDRRALSRNGDRLLL